MMYQDGQDFIQLCIRLTCCISKKSDSVISIKTFQTGLVMKGWFLMKIVYIPSESMTTNGKEAKIYKKYGKEWNIKPLGKGNGQWLLTKPSDVLVDEISCRIPVLNHYEKIKLTEKLVDKFKKDVEDGKIQIEFCDGELKITNIEK